MSSILEDNIRILASRFPKVAESVISLNGRAISVMSAKDGGSFFAVQSPDGNWQPVSNPENPVECAQKSLDLMMHRILYGLSPAVVVGLAPGYVLETVFNHFESRIKHSEPFRHIYVIIDSPECLVCWLSAADRSRILKQPEVEFYLVSDIQKIVELCESDFNRSHLFLPVSELPEEITSRIINPLAELYMKRERETETWHRENCDYYDSIGNAELAKIIQGKAGRKPRLMMPTHASSTVVQYSARDTCEIFDKLGWETKILKIEHDLPPWLLTKNIHEFKPDLFIFINHLRTEDENVELYPKNMPFVTWVQDTIPAVNKQKAAEVWNKAVEGRKRDMIIGYVEQLSQYGYAEEKLFPCDMIVNTSIFRHVVLSPEQKEKYACDVCFASNRSQSSAWAIEHSLLPNLSSLGFTEESLLELEAGLWGDYRAGHAYSTYASLKGRILETSSFKRVFESLSEEGQDNILQRVFWLLNDIIYRHVVLEWLDEYSNSHPGFKLHLYGKGWENHPRFAKHARGQLAHGAELNLAYNAAKACLHLNSLEGAHQRGCEILASGTSLIQRNSFSKTRLSDWESALVKIVKSHLLEMRQESSLLDDLSPAEMDGLLDWAFYKGLQHAHDGNGNYVVEKLLSDFKDSLAKNPQILLRALGCQFFDSKEALWEILQREESASKADQMRNGSLLNDIVISRLLSCISHFLDDEKCESLVSTQHSDLERGLLRCIVKPISEYAMLFESFRSSRGKSVEEEAAFLAGYQRLPGRSRRIATDAYALFRGVNAPEPIAQDFQRYFETHACSDFESFFTTLCVGASQFGEEEARKILLRHIHWRRAEKLPFAARTLNSMLFWGARGELRPVLQSFLEEADRDKEKFVPEESQVLLEIAQKLIDLTWMREARLFLGLLHPEALSPESLQQAAYAFLQIGDLSASRALSCRVNCKSPIACSVKALEHLMDWYPEKSLQTLEDGLANFGELPSLLFYKAYVSWFAGREERSSWEAPLLKILALGKTGWESWTRTYLGVFNRDIGEFDEAMNWHQKARDGRDQRQAWLVEFEAALSAVLSGHETPLNFSEPGDNIESLLLPAFGSRLLANPADILEQATRFRWKWLGHERLAKAMLLYRLDPAASATAETVAKLRQELLDASILYPDSRKRVSKLLGEPGLSPALAEELAKGFYPFLSEKSFQRKAVAMAIQGMPQIL